MMLLLLLLLLLVRIPSTPRAHRAAIRREIAEPRGTAIVVVAVVVVVLEKKLSSGAAAAGAVEVQTPNDQSRSTRAQKCEWVVAAAATTTDRMLLALGSPLVGRGSHRQRSALVVVAALLEQMIPCCLLWLLLLLLLRCGLIPGFCGGSVFFASFHRCRWLVGVVSCKNECGNAVFRCERACRASVSLFFQATTVVRVGPVFFLLLLHLLREEI